MKKICFFVVLSVASGWDVYSASVLIPTGADAKGLQVKRVKKQSGASAEEVQGLQLKWMKKQRGAISDLSVSKNGRAILVATSPDPDIQGSASTPLLTSWNEKGAQLFQLALKSPAKDQDLSADGSMAVVSNYENQLIALDSEGRILWTREGMCKPRFLSSQKKILCYHDDDADPKVAFDLYDFSGKKEYSYPIEDDIVGLKISPDDKHWVIGLSQGYVVAFGAPHSVFWKGRVEGEIIDVAVASGDAPRVAVLFRAQDHLQKLAVFDAAGKLLGVQTPQYWAIQIEMSSDGNSIFYYGNSTEGQHVGSFSVTPFKEIWSKGGSIPATYSSSILLAQQGILMGYEQTSKLDRSSHFLAFDSAGKPIWDLPLSTEEGAYLYSQKVALAPGLLAVGTDDARLSILRCPSPF